VLEDEPADLLGDSANGGEQGNQWFSAGRGHQLSGEKSFIPRRRCDAGGYGRDLPARVQDDVW
jgi:hypothetical protein